jgi:hypothetical protein
MADKSRDGTDATGKRPLRGRLIKWTVIGALVGILCGVVGGVIVGVKISGRLETSDMIRYALDRAMLFGLIGAVLGAAGALLDWLSESPKKDRRS